MPEFIAFLRAINVTNRYIKMVDLRRSFEDAGCREVATYIQTGNVVFQTDEAQPAALEAHLERHLAQAFSFDVPTMVRSVTDFLAVAAASPFGPPPAGEVTTDYVSFLKAAPDPKRSERVLTLTDGIERYAIDGPQLYWRWHRDRGEFTVDQCARGTTAGNAGDPPQCHHYPQDSAQVLATSLSPG